MPSRKIQLALPSIPTIEGAGVHLKRAFGSAQLPQFDPFLMLDDFHSANPAAYRAGFPWHPHRGIETITYLLEGRVEHGDSMGNQGIIGAGDVQWMTAGSGVIHQEMPRESPTGTLWGFQFWANLSAGRKMTPPRYQEVKAAEIPVVTLSAGVTAKVIAGTVNGVQGPVTDIVIAPEMLDLTIPAGTGYEHPVPGGHTAFVYILSGEACCDESGQWRRRETVLLFDREGDVVKIETRHEPVRVVLVSGKPLGEPVAWGGPIVMNTREELDLAFKEYEQGTFIKQQNLSTGAAS